MFLWWYTFFKKKEGIKKEAFPLVELVSQVHSRVLELTPTLDISLIFEAVTTGLVKKHQFIIASNDSKRFKLFPCHTNNLSFYMDTMFFYDLLYYTYKGWRECPHVFFWTLEQ